MALQGPGGLCCVFSVRFMVQLSQKEETHEQQPEGSAAPMAYLGGRRRHPPPQNCERL